MSPGPALATTTGTVGPFLVAKLRALDARLGEVAPRVLESAGDEDAVHDLRVALRRTRTVLEVGRRVLGRFHADEVRRAMRALMRATGDLRDEEVFLELVASIAPPDAGPPDVQAWVDARRRRERHLRGELARLLHSGELDRGRALLDALLAFRVDPAHDRRVTKFARRAVDRARRKVDRRSDAQPDDPDALHRLRIAYKRLRYTVETLADSLPDDLAALAQPASRLQSRLGDLHDVDIAVGRVRRARTLSSASRAELLAGLASVRDVRLAAYLRELGAAASPPPAQAVGTDSLRKTSTR
ncbi:MAG TPA: CHAD domain-containing protein [Polyangiaceae bacterium]|jgi:CHAD domain-containing protein